MQLDLEVRLRVLGCTECGLHSHQGLHDLEGTAGGGVRTLPGGAVVIISTASIGTT